MNKDQVKGATQKAVGSTKDAIGKATGNDKLRAEGAMDKVAGAAKETVGKAKEQVHKATR